ncbi:MAG: GcrA family cell cycle regulator [Rhodomicrobium sp.]
MSWNVERVDTLKALWADGLSASQVAAKLGSVTRNAVIAKVHRLKLPPREKTRAQARLKRPAPRVRPWRPLPTLPPVRAALQLPAPLPELEPAPGGGPQLADLKDSMCHWPIGDPKRPGFHFCGRAKSFGAYCGHHAAIAFNPKARRRA